jgi:hypothetical protein
VGNPDHQVFGFSSVPWPLPLGPKRLRLKAALADFTDSLCDALSDAMKRDWPGPGRAITVTMSSDRALIEITSSTGDLSIDVEHGLWAEP